MDSSFRVKRSNVLGFLTNEDVIIGWIPTPKRISSVNILTLLVSSHISVSFSFLYEFSRFHVPSIKVDLPEPCDSDIDKEYQNVVPVHAMHVTYI